MQPGFSNRTLLESLKKLFKYVKPNNVLQETLERRANNKVTAFKLVDEPLQCLSRTFGFRSLARFQRTQTQIWQLVWVSFGKKRKQTQRTRDERRQKDKQGTRHTKASLMHVGTSEILFVGHNALRCLLPLVLLAEFQQMQQLYNSSILRRYHCRRICV